MRALSLLTILIQATWGFPQFVCGALLRLVLMPQHFEHEHYRSAYVLLWSSTRGLSLGPFIFMPQSLAGKAKQRLLAHEYGHTIQSLILGPLYLPVIVLPSLSWAGIPALERHRQHKQLSYYSFYTERWANHLSYLVTHETPEGYRDA